MNRHVINPGGGAVHIEDVDAFLAVGDDLETLLPTLTDMSLAELRVLDLAEVAEPLKRVREQVERARPNLGGGPPGRAD